MTESEEMVAVCAELDSVLIELMECLDQLAELRERLSHEVRAGYYSMAKARYSMGPLSVGQLQYHSVMVPTCLVEVDEGAAPDCQGSDEQALGVVDKGEELTTTHNVFRVHRSSAGVRRAGEGVTMGGGDEGHLRRRRPQTGEAEPGREASEGVEEVTVGEKSRLKNPLNWFGVLVPQALRQSQEHFIRATDVCGELATEQARLESLRLHYTALLHRKQQLKT